VRKDIHALILPYPEPRRHKMGVTHGSSNGNRQAQPHSKNTLCQEIT
jgi:hypothetical protein